MRWRLFDESSAGSEKRVGCAYADDGDGANEPSDELHGDGSERSEK
jgi:hypothetical protein